MNLFDFFFPEQAQAAHLRRVADSQSMHQRQRYYEDKMQARRHAQIDERFKSVEQQLGFLTLMLEAIIRTTEEKGVVTREELKKLMEAIDLEDGKADGRYTPKKGA